MPEGWTPAFEGQREPFTPGHMLSLTHGGYSPRVQGERAEAVLAELREVAPDWLTSADAAQVELYCFALGQVRGLQAWLAERPPARPNGSPWPVEKALHAWQRQLQASLDRLGLNPLSRARGLRDSAVASAVAAQVVGRAAATGRALREAHEARVAS